MHLSPTAFINHNLYEFHRLIPYYVNGGILFPLNYQHNYQPDNTNINQINNILNMKSEPQLHF